MCKLRVRGFIHGCLLGVLTASNIGCGNKTLIEVTGTITLNGEPVEEVSVTFVPEDDNGQHAYATTGTDGVFRLSTFKNDGAMPGDYRVVVIKFLETKGERIYRSLLPEVYATASTTPLKCTVPHQGPVNLNLESKS